MAPYDDERLSQVFDQTRGRCACCKKQLAFGNYGINAFREGRRGAWEVDHRVPVSRGGSDNLRNLQPMCVPCNRAKVDRGHCAACGCRR